MRREQDTPFGILVRDTVTGGHTIYAHEGNLWDWAHRPGALWPCSTLATLNLPDVLTVRFATNGDLVDIEGTEVDIPADELTAWAEDVVDSAGTADRIAAFLLDVHKAGVAAGSWVLDGNTTDETARRLLDGIENGDPAILDELPAPMWDGQWADEPTYERLARDAGLTEDEADDVYADALAAFSQGMEDEVIRSARYVLGLDEEHRP